MDATDENRESFLPKSEARPRVLPLAISLYRTDLLFRGLADIALVGFVIITFMKWDTITRQASELAKPVIAAVSGQESPKPARLLGQSGTGPGAATVSTLPEMMKIDRDVIRSAPPEIAKALAMARQLQDLGNMAGALVVLSRFDSGEPSIAYAKASVILQQNSIDRLTEAQKLLRKATAQAIAPAYTLSGMVPIKLLIMLARNAITPGQLKTLDGAGNIVKADEETLGAEAKLWLERAAALDQVDAIRLLGFAELRGMGGKKNFSAAIAHWRDAASRGDSASKFELGWAHAMGIGLKQDSKKAISYMQESADGGFVLANVGLAMSLMPKSMAGDTDAAEKIMTALERATESDVPRALRKKAELITGSFLFEGAPPSMRDPQKAVKHWHEALMLGEFKAAVQIAKSYQAGAGVKRDLVKAHAYLDLVLVKIPAAAEMLSEIRSEMSDEQLHDARGYSARLRNELRMPLGGARMIPSVRRFKPVQKRLGKGGKKDGYSVRMPDGGSATVFFKNGSSTSSNMPTLPK